MIDVTKIVFLNYMTEVNRQSEFWFCCFDSMTLLSKCKLFSFTIIKCHPLPLVFFPSNYSSWLTCNVMLFEMLCQSLSSTSYIPTAVHTGPSYLWATVGHSPNSSLSRLFSCSNSALLLIISVVIATQFVL